jgi:hypothetical protein
MISSPRRLALSLIAGGVFALVGGTVLGVTTGVTLLGMTGQVLGTWFSYVPMFSEPTPRPMPALEPLLPAVGLVAGITLFLGGWVAIIRGAAHGWPARFDRSSH